ncbi:MAG: hypothetical protein Q9160_000286 [Pyrenula sp. 1 TL-2023]
MAAGPHTFVTYDVFTAERYQGNPLAIVSPRGSSTSLTQAQKQRIVREFGYSETVFLYDGEELGKPRQMEIFTIDQEIPFAGHPVIGTAHYIFNALERSIYPPTQPGQAPNHNHNRNQSTVLLTKAGPVTVNYNPYRQVAAAQVPHNIHVHSSHVSTEALLDAHPQLSNSSLEGEIKGLQGRKEGFPVISLVKGMTFALVNLTGYAGVMKALRAGPTVEVSGKLDDGWSETFLGAMYFTHLPSPTPSSTPSPAPASAIPQSSSFPSPKIHHLRARMIESGIEDPATGSGCCALACYLALQLGLGDEFSDGEGDDSNASERVAKGGEKGEDGNGKKEAHHVFAIEQGVEMGRRSQICVEVWVVAVDEDGNGDVNDNDTTEKSQGGEKGAAVAGKERDGAEQPRSDEEGDGGAGAKDKGKGMGKGKAKGKVKIKEVVLSGRACSVMQGQLHQIF